MTMPDGAAISRTSAVVEKLDKAIMADPLVADVMSFCATSESSTLPLPLRSCNHISKPPVLLMPLIGGGLKGSPENTSAS